MFRGQTGLLAFALLLALASAGCSTKKKELINNVSPDPVIRKADVENKLYYLVRGIEEADSENNVGAVPGFHETYGIVKVEITQKEVQLKVAYSPTGRPETARVIASYPILGHLDIKREENDFKEQTNKIIEDTKRDWNQREFMRVDWSKPSTAFSSIATQLDERSPQEEGQLVEENATLEEPLKIENGHISFLVSTSIKGPGMFKYVPPFSFERIPSFRVKYRTHLMPVKDGDFKAVEYSLKDFERFGYFTNQQNFDDPVKGYLDANRVIHANVFNVCEAGTGRSCSTNKITWFLNKGFPEKYVDVTRQAVADWNITFKQALGRTDDVVVLDESKKVDISDPRQNVIALYQPRAGGGLLGVAQWVADPRTGETIAARSTVYDDGIRRVVGLVDTLIDVLAAQDPFEDVLGTGSIGPVNQPTSPYRDADVMRAELKSMRAVLGFDKKPALGQGSLVEELKDLATRPMTRPDERAPLAYVSSDSIGESRLQKLMRSRPASFIPTDLERLGGALKAAQLSANSKDVAGQFKNLNGIERLLYAHEIINNDRERFLKQSRMGIHAVEMVEDAAINYLMRVARNAKSPEDLRKHKQQILEEVAKLTYYTTLLHEMGHTFGLRHNFAGSADKGKNGEHFHPEYARIQQRLAAKDPNVSADDLQPFAYSSIMDYGADFYSNAGGLGPYDKAAIKYAYNRSIDKNNDAIVKTKFKFCTDHQVGEDLLCRRFDKGTTVAEVTSNLINHYHREWPLTHLRRGRANFEEYADTVPLRMITRQMMPVRQVMDELVYLLIASDDVKEEPAKGPRHCGARFMDDSINMGEIANVCNNAEAIKAGVTPGDWSTFANALIDPKTGEFRKDPATYVPYGLADMVYANFMAQKFFMDVIHSTEPGIFLAQESETEGQPATLIPIPGTAPTAEGRLRAFAANNQIPNAEAWVKELLPQATVVGMGRYAKPYESARPDDGTFPTLQNLGAFWDKLAALRVLSTRNVGVRKYRVKTSLTGNAYAYPQSKAFTVRLFGGLITGDAQMQLPVKLGSGKVVTAQAKVAQDINTKAISTIFALTQLVLDSDQDMVDRLRVCNSDQTGCLSERGNPVAEFVSVSGQDRFRAAQTDAGDSIVFAMIDGAQKTDKDLTSWIAKEKAAPAVREANAKTYAALDQIRLRVLSMIDVDENFAPLAILLSDKEVEQPKQNGKGEEQQLSPIWIQVKAVVESGAGSSINPDNIDRVTSAIVQVMQVSVNIANQAIEAIGQDKSPEAAQKLMKLESLKKDFAAIAAAVGPLMTSSKDALRAPAQVKSLRSNLKSKQSDVQFVHQLLRELDK